MKRRLRLFVLNDQQVMRIDRELAKEIGFNESVVLLQLEYLIGISQHERDGLYWTYQALRELHEQHFPWWSIATLSRTIRHLEEMELIHISNYNRLGQRRAVAGRRVITWLSLTYARYGAIVCP